MPVREEIKEHKAAVLAGEVKCTRVDCPICEGVPDAFKVHERRKRWFYVVTGRFVERLISLLIRWKCPLCGKTFTQYPPFALPHKRYVRQVVEALAGKYVNEESCTYREAVKVRGGAIGYASVQDDEIDERQLVHSTIWRWLSFLGELKETLRKAHGLIRAKAPASVLSRNTASIAPHKYRTTHRRNVLRGVLRLMYAGQAYRRLFGRSIFPELATGAGWV
jgi:transposase-like protein